MTIDRKSKREQYQRARRAVAELSPISRSRLLREFAADLDFGDGDEDITITLPPGTDIDTYVFPFSMESYGITGEHLDYGIFSGEDWRSPKAPKLLEETEDVEKLP